MSFFKHFTPIGLFLLVLGYGIFGAVVGHYFISKLNYLWIIAVVLTLLFTYRYQNPPLYPSQRYGVVFARVGALFMVISFIQQLIFSGILFQEPVIQQKNQLNQIKTTLPKHPTTIRSSKSHQSFLELNHARFRCLEDDKDVCDKAYDFYGQSATVLYYPDRFHGNVIYEIKVGGHDIYQFEHQKATFIENRKKLLRQFLLALLFYVLPAVVFWFIDKAVSADIPIADEQNIQQETDRQNRLMAHMGVGGIIIMSIGFMGVMFGVLSLMLSWKTSDWADILLSVAFILFCAFIIYLPNKYASHIDEQSQSDPTPITNTIHHAHAPNHHHPHTNSLLPLPNHIPKLPTPIAPPKQEPEYEEIEIQLNIIYYFNVISWGLLAVFSVVFYFSFTGFIYIALNQEIDLFIKMVYLIGAVLGGAIVYQVIAIAHTKREFVFDEHELDCDDLADYPIKGLFGDWLFSVAFFGAILSVGLAIWAYYLGQSSALNTNLMSLLCLVFMMFGSRFFKKYH